MVFMVNIVEETVETVSQQLREEEYRYVIVSASYDGIVMSQVRRPKKKENVKVYLNYLVFKSYKT